jgi:hypothetical protein
MSVRGGFVEGEVGRSGDLPREFVLSFLKGGENI